MAITHLILVGSLKPTYLISGWKFALVPAKKDMTSDHLTKIDHKKFFRRNKIFDKTNFFTKETFQWSKLFKETNFSTKIKTFCQNFSSKQLFRCNKLFNKTNILTKHTFWWNKLFYETNFEIKQTLLLIYYSDYWNLKFVIDSFFVSFKNFLFPSVQQGIIVISV